MKTIPAKPLRLTPRELSKFGLPTYTPWDAPQSVYFYGPGIAQYHTAGHGGFWLAPEAFAKFHALFPHAQLWAGAPWFEEDCDAALVVLAFPELFSDEALDYAQHALKHRTDGALADFNNNGARFEIAKRVLVHA